MIPYKIKVVKLKESRTFLRTADEGSFFSADEGDVFVGYSHRRQKVNRFFDLWLSDPDDQHSDDRNNLISFGRIKYMSYALMDGQIVFGTRYGTFIMEAGAYETLENTDTVH